MSTEPVGAREAPGELVELVDRLSGARAWLAVEERGAGPAFGGTRRRDYASAAAARDDARALARAMSEKCALYALPAGGAKLVLYAEGRSREEAYRWLGREVEARRGALFTGPDIGTGAAELAWLAAETRACVRAEEAERYARATALGVRGALRAALEHAEGSGVLAGRSFLVQGLGQVGALLAELLVESGARVRASEADPVRGAAVAARIGLELVPCGSELDAACDALLPCAAGGLLTDAAARALRAPLVCGSANNQAADIGAVARFHARGGLFVPDVLASAGALLRGVERHVLARELGDEALEERVRVRVLAVLAAARAAGRSPAETAAVEASREVAQRRSRSPVGRNVW